MISTSGSGQMVPIPINECLRQDFAAAGFDIDFDVVEWGTMIVARRSNPSPQTSHGDDGLNNGPACTGPSTRYRLLATAGFPPASTNGGRFSNTTFDDLTARAQATADRDAQVRLLAEAHAILVDEAAWLRICHDLNPRAMSKHVEGFVPARSWSQDFTHVIMAWPLHEWAAMAGHHDNATAAETRCHRRTVLPAAGNRHSRPFQPPRRAHSIAGTGAVTRNQGATMLTKPIHRRGFLAGTGAALFAASGVPARADAPRFKTVEPGVLTIANSNEMPMIGMEDGKLIGSEAEMIAAIAKRMGLGVKSAQMEWSATVQSVKSGRADIMLGNMGWTPARAAVLAITDAIYYAGAFVCMKKGQPFDKAIAVSDIKGHSIGTVNGFTIVPEMKKVPGTTEVKLYDNSDGCVRDVVIGRLDFAVLDGPLVDYMIVKNPNWNLKQVALAGNPAFPQLTSKQHTVMGMNQGNHDLFDAVNAGVKWLWRTKQNAAFMNKYGTSNPDYLVPPEKNPRIGVDRDANNDVIGPSAHKPADFSALFA